MAAKLLLMLYFINFIDIVVCFRKPRSTLQNSAVNFGGKILSTDSSNDNVNCEQNILMESITCVCDNGNKVIFFSFSKNKIQLVQET